MPGLASLFTEEFTVPCQNDEDQCSSAVQLVFIGQGTDRESALMRAEDEAERGAYSTDETEMANSPSYLLVLYQTGVGLAA